MLRMLISSSAVRRRCKRRCLSIKHYQGDTKKTAPLLQGCQRTACCRKQVLICASSHLGTAWQIHRGQLQSHVLPSIEIYLPSFPCYLCSLAFMFVIFLMSTARSTTHSAASVLFQPQPSLTSATRPITMSPSAAEYLESAAGCRE